ncbi:MAG: uroporphyrinogen decarboxylase [Verrucomicrobia bacterium]|nr:uroporphyrinogen decarboxylase [Verrucomicrobiota bacterium]
MTGKERVKKTFACASTDRIPWVPFVGCHAGGLIGVPAGNVLKHARHIVDGAAAAVEHYKPDGIPVTFDLQIEAEAMGCKLVWAEENPPSVATHILAEGTKMDSLRVPAPDAARIGMVLDATRQIRKNHPDIALYGLITGPFTLALHLMGTEIFVKMFDDPAYVKQLMTFCSNVCKAMSGYYIDAGCDIVAVVDPMTSQIGPDQFRDFVSEHAKTVFDEIRNRRALGSFFVCGHAEQNVTAMCECRPDNISVDENIPLDYVKGVCLPRKISFGGNMRLTSVLLLGSPVDAQRDAIACIEKGGPKGFVLSPGCDLPYAVPVKNLEAVAAVALDPYQRDIVRVLATDDRKDELLNLQDYGRADKVIVDIITLDSEACAPCQYMVESVKAVAPEFEGIVIWREHKIKHRESLVFMTSLMVRNVPTICIDGEIRFVSRIPARDDLIAAIQRRINEKLRLKIQSRKATIHILGDGGDVCRKLRDNIRKAITELGAEITVEMTTDAKKIAAYGFTMGMTPAVVVSKHQTKSTRHVPEVAIIKEWIKDLM